MPSRPRSARRQSKSTGRSRSWRSTRPSGEVDQTTVRAQAAPHVSRPSGEEELATDWTSTNPPEAVAVWRELAALRMRQRASATRIIAPSWRIPIFGERQGGAVLAKCDGGRAPLGASRCSLAPPPPLSAEFPAHSRGRRPPSASAEERPAGKEPLARCPRAFHFHFLLSGVVSTGAPPPPRRPRARP